MGVWKFLKKKFGGEQFFEELDRDGDERVTVEDVKVALRKRGLPDAFAAKFVQSTRGNHWWSNSIGCAGLDFSFAPFQP